MKKDALIIVRGGGDLATGTIHRLWSAGLRVLVLETTQAAAIRRQVALCEAVYEGETTVEGLRAVRIETLEQAQSVWAQGAVPVLVDPEGACIARAKPEVVVDAILAKRNLGTCRNMAPLTIALGPGFVAGQDVMPWWRPNVATGLDGSFGREALSPIPASPALLAGTVQSG